MVNYFEARNSDNGTVVIDDVYKNVELSAVYNLALFNREEVRGSVSYFCKSETNNDDILWGIGLKELAGKTVTPEIYAGGGVIQLYFHDANGGGTSARPAEDIMRVGKLYSFAYRNREPTPHMAGLEVYSDQGAVLYSSDAKYLQVLSCGAHESATTPISDRAVAFTLGIDFANVLYVYAASIYGESDLVCPQFAVSANSVSVSEKKYNEVYSFDGSGSGIDLREVYHTGARSYGWMIGEIL
nr:MAG TPA: hypothetical protein [Caudoviricetes sp.]